MNLTAVNHYDQKYFEWQKGCGDFGGWANLIKFERFIQEEDNVVDFGCGGGFLLQNLKCTGKLGVEINPAARLTAQQNGVKTVGSPSEIPDDWATICISNNALEHATEPLKELKEIYKKLRSGGRAVFVVPCENITWAYKPGDINYHLYSWGPMTLGNLFTEAGFEVIESKPFIHKWPKNYKAIARIVGPKLFHFICRIYGRYERTWFQVRVVAKKK